MSFDKCYFLQEQLPFAWNTRHLRAYNETYVDFSETLVQIHKQSQTKRLTTVSSPPWKRQNILCSQQNFMLHCIAERYVHLIEVYNEELWTEQNMHENYCNRSVRFLCKDRSERDGHLLFSWIQSDKYVILAIQFAINFPDCVDSCGFPERRNSSVSPSAAHETSSCVM